MPDAARSPDSEPDRTEKTFDPEETVARPGTPQNLELSGTLSATGALARTLGAPTHTANAVDLSDCVLDDFRLLRRLGSGGMAQVYLAEQMSLQRTVAIKVMRSDFDGDDTFEQRFEHEARAAAGLNHHSIVQVYAVGHTDGIRYIAQEYVHGLNLRQYIQKRKPPNAHVAVHLMKQVCSALQAAHKAGIVHRDIKPENIMVTRKMSAKVTDFGLAQLTLAGERVNLTQRGVTMGTPMYMSPEQVNGANVDPRSDLYSLGVTFYHVLSGRPPFEADTALALAYKHLNDEAASLRDRRPDLPQSLIGVVSRLMAKDPDDRFPDARAVLTELKRIEQSGEVHTSSFEMAEDESPSRWRLAVSRQTVKTYVIACLLVFMVSWGMGRDRRRSNPLNSPPAAPRVPLRDTAQAQVSVARTLASGPTRDNRATEEEAWRLVIERFPDVTRSVMEAHLELGLLQMSQRRYKEALSHFDAMAREHDNEWKARGIAGQAALASLTGRYAESHELIHLQLRDLRDDLDDRMVPYVRKAMRINSQQGGSNDPDVEELFAPQESIDG